MKTLYFIRHGQSTGNASLWVQQGSHTELTSTGVAQAKAVAAHMKKFPIQAIIASPFARTKATAAEVARELNLQVEYSELFVEHRRPGIQLRKRKLHPLWLWAQLHLSLFSRFSSYRYSDEETPDEILKRAHIALAYLSGRSEEHIIVVTHGRFMRALYAAISMGEGVTGRAYLRLTRTVHMRNTALMVATNDTDKWEVKAWNADAQTI
jgi:broad specificity phosphatase PhoE